MQIRVIDTPTPELDELARSSPEGTFYHTRTWIESLQSGLPSFRYRCLEARSGDDVLGVFPYFVQQRGAFRSAWSMPLGTYGGPITRADSEVRSQLVQHFLKTLNETGVYEVGWVDYHGLDPEAEDLEPALTHLVDLEGGFDAVWNDRFDKKRRQRTRRAEREGVVVERTTDLEDLRKFHRVYLTKMKAWGAPSRLPERLFRDLLHRGGDQVRLFVARRGEDILGGHFNFYYGDMVMAWCGLSTRESRTYQPDSLLYTTCMRDACERGFRFYNLGGSMGLKTLIQFKNSLGGVGHTYSMHRRRSALAKALHAMRGLTKGRSSTALDAQRAVG